ncbi:hypothetical protein B484DRAFT_398213 [Ochromonadaceae sp. CCMP2298]|nr:hypothetical protein B484DRAFT_398213 [Ochromonadaceae sp. CCMP2298]
MTSRLNKIFAVVAERREAQEEAVEVGYEEGWEPMDVKKFKWVLPVVDPVLSKPVFHMHDHEGFRIVDAPVLEAVLGRLFEDNPRWNFLNSSTKKASTTHRHLYKFLAVKIRIYGLQACPSESVKKPRPLTCSVNEAKTHFSGLRPNECQDAGRMLKLFTYFLFNQDHCLHLSFNFQQLLEEVGDHVAGDEKLYKFFGDAANIVHCPSKPDKIGHWFYQFMVKLRSGKPYMLVFFLRLSKPDLACNVVRMVDIGQPGTILAFDSYYMCKDVRTYLQEHKYQFRYCASVQLKRFKPIFNACLREMEKQDADVVKPGDWCSIYRPESEETYSYVWDRQRGVNKKYCLTNLVTRMPRLARDKTGTSPLLGYDTYKSTFALCDVYNRALHDRKWPHKSGGHGVAGEDCNMDNFAFASVLQNIFNAYDDIRCTPKGEFEFRRPAGTSR